MARSPAEIQADIALTRRTIEDQLDAIRCRMPDRTWGPWVVMGGAVVTGMVLARFPFLSLVEGAARVVRTGLIVASTLATVDSFVSARRIRRAA
jgi:hypothetical protein